MPRSAPELYAELTAALFDARTDPATARFDEVLAEAQRAGRLDAETARALRWWQRESLRGVQAHVETVFPALLAALASANASVATAVHEAEESWRAALSDAAANPRPGGQTDSPTDLVERRRRLVVAGLLAAHPADPADSHLPRTASEDTR